MKRLRIGSLFSGIGGLDLAVEGFFGAETAWHCEWDDEPSKVLAARWPGVPNYRDVRTVDWAAVEPVDIMCGGFPCQDVSLAGRRAGMKEGTRSGLWSEFARAIDIVRPRVVVIENVRGLISADAGGDVEPCPWCMGDGQDEYHLRALDAVVADLSDLGFDAEWTGLRAADVGAPHGRFRFFLLAYARGVRFDSRWDAASRQAAGGRASTVTGGRADAPVDRPLLRTPVADELGGGPLHPDVAKERGQTLRLSGQILALGGHLKTQLLPTPVAQPSGNNTPEEHLRKKPGREVVTDLAILVENGLLATGGRLLPTPVTEPDTGNGHARNLGKEVCLLPTPVSTNVSGNRVNNRGEHLLPGVAAKLLPTPRAARGASGTETMYRLGAERDDTGDRQGNVTLMPTPQVADATGGHASRSGERSDELLLPGLARELAVNWGDYEPAVRLWESLTRPAPAPTLPDGKNGNHRLAAVFPEWLMGYEAGWVTDIIGRNPAIKACGNGVVPQQAYAALTILWARVLRWAVAA